MRLEAVGERGREERSRCGGRLAAGSGPRGCGSSAGRNCCPGKLEGKGRRVRVEGGEKKGEAEGERGRCRKEKGEVREWGERQKKGKGEEG